MRGDFMNTLNIGSVCISSVYVREAHFKDYRYTVYRAASDLGYNVYRNPETPGSTQEKFEKFLEQKRPIFVLIIGTVKSELVMDECRKALSLGLPIITLLQKTKSGRISESAKKLMKSISKVTFEKACSTFTDCEDLYVAVQQRLVDYENERKISTASFVPQHPQIYAKTNEIIHQAKKRIILCQRTSTLLLGPRKGVSYEVDFYNALYSWLRKADEDMEFLHIFSLEDTKKALAGNEYNILSAKNNLIKLYTTDKLKIASTIRSIDNSIMPCVIGDNNLLVLMQLGKQEYNLFLPHYITDGASISKIAADLQGLDGQLLYSSEEQTTTEIENFYK